MNEKWNDNTKEAELYRDIAILQRKIFVKRKRIACIYAKIEGNHNLQTSTVNELHKEKGMLMQEVVLAKRTIYQLNHLLENNQ